MNEHIKHIDIILGCSFGDEGKGKVVHCLLDNSANNYQLCVRFNGSANAGHTIHKNNQTYVVHQLPVGMLVDNIYNVISSDCLIDIQRLREELNELKEKGIDTKGRLFISKACHIITSECIEYDKKNNQIGTTCSGVGPTFSLKMLRTGKRVEDFSDEITSLGVEIIDMRTFWQSEFMKKSVTNILMEGAQGFELDINWTNHYPYCTSSTCTLGGAINTGIPYKKIRHIYGVTKAYDTYVGTRQFQPIENSEYNDILNNIGDIGKEYGSTTGRRRQINFMNLDYLLEALIINNCNQCIINKMDILREVNTYNLYYNQQLVGFQTLEEFQQFIVDKLKVLHINPIFSFTPLNI